MFGTRMLARLMVSALGAIAFQTLVAGEPAASTPPAQSVREWMPTPGPAPAAAASATPPAQALAAGAPVVTTPTARSIREWMPTPGPAPAPSPSATPTGQALVAAAPVGPKPPARSVREWMTTPSPAPGPCPTASPIAIPAVASAAVPKSPITISLKSTLREGNLVVILDNVPIFNEKFQKPFLLVSQTTTLDPLQIAAGAHRLSAKVYGAKKTYFSAIYDLDVSRTKGAALRFVMQGDTLKVELAS